MAITDITAEAPCPLFAGRGMDKRGFTLALPKKGYLSCTPDNIDSENYVLGVYNYDLATRVKDDTADTIAFGVWVETGSDTDAVTTAKHMHAVDFSMKVTEAYTFAAGSERNADVRCARVRIEALNSIDGVIHGMYLNTRLHASNDPTFKGRYLEYTSSYGGIGLEIRTEIIGETGTATLGDGTSYGLCGLLVTHKADAGVTAVTGAYQGIAMHCPYEGTSFSGATTGILFINTVILAGTAWDVGIDFGDSMVVTGIDIGACTTGITFTGACTTILNVATNLVIPKLITIGTSANGVQWDGVAENILVYIEATPTSMSTKTAVKINLEASNDGAVTSGRLECFRANFDSYSTNNITTSGGIRALVGQVSFNGNCTLVNSSYPQGTFGVIGSIWSGSNLTATSGYLAAIGAFWGIETGSTVTTAQSSMIYCYIFGKTAPGSLINIWQGSAPSHITYFLEITSASSIPHAFIDDTSIAQDNSSDGRIKIRLGSTTYYIPIFA